MHLRRPGLAATAGFFAVALVVLTGCATVPPQGEGTAEAAETAEPPAPREAEGELGDGPAVRVQVAAPDASSGECPVRVYALHGSGLEPHVVHRTVELYGRSDDVFLVSLAGASEVPSEYSVETVDGMQTPITGENLTMGCDEVRAEVLIERCEPSPCPSYGAYEEGDGPIPVVVKTDDAE